MCLILLYKTLYHHLLCYYVQDKPSTQHRACCCSWHKNADEGNSLDISWCQHWFTALPVRSLTHSSWHFLLRWGFGFGHRTARIASSNTVLSPFWVSAEHSRYLTAPISFAIARPWQTHRATTAGCWRGNLSPSLHTLPEEFQFKISF